LYSFSKLSSDYGAGTNRLRIGEWPVTVGAK
jgi:hypothetical protein